MSSPIQRFKKNMARIVLNARSSTFTKQGNKNIRAMFKAIDPKYHNLIADDYPAYLETFLEDEEGIAWWHKVTADRETDVAKNWYFFEVRTVSKYLRQFHQMP